MVEEREMPGNPEISRDFPVFCFTKRRAVTKIIIFKQKNFRKPKCKRKIPCYCSAIGEFKRFLALTWDFEGCEIIIAE